AGLIDQPHAADLHNTLGVVTARQGQAAGSAPSVLAKDAAGYFLRALACDPQHAVAGLNAARALAASGQYQPAIDQARRTLSVLERATNLAPNWLQAPLFPPAFDALRVAWEKA